MYFRLLSLTLRKNNSLFFKRSFRTNPWQLKDTEQGKQSKKEIGKDEPVKFSTSEAAKWKAVYSSSGPQYHETPRIQPFATAVSLTAFMVYFCILREENDLDDWMRELETNVPAQVEELQLRVEIEHERKKGIDVSWKEARLNELVSRRNQKQIDQ